jgi:cytochrome P450
MNKLPYITAVMKEALRLFPSASGFREGKPGVSITDEDGTAYPTDNCYVWVVHLALHRDPKYFKDPDSFLPERWLVGPDDPYTRPRVRGDLSNLDLKIALARALPSWR